MGLDGVELIMEVEDEFGISIPDEDAERLRTIGDVAAYVTAVRRGVDPGLPACAPRPCDGSRAFYAWRRLLTARLGVDRRAVVPAASVRSLVPRPARRDAWQAAAEAGIHVPPLEGHTYLVVLVIAIGAAAGLLVAVHVHLALMFPTIAAVGAAGLWLLDLVRRDLPRGCVTVAGLARASWVSPPPVAAAPGDHDPRPMDHDVMERVFVIVSEQMGVPVTSLTPQTRFAEDLGV